MTLFDADQYIERAPVPGVIPVCHRCGARGEPIPASSHPGDNRWWEGVAFALITLKEHEPLCPGRPPGEQSPDD